MTRLQKALANYAKHALPILPQKELLTGRERRTLHLDQKIARARSAIPKARGLARPPLAKRKLERRALEQFRVLGKG